MGPGHIKNKNRLYNVCDMYLFGYIEDMEKYFDVPVAENLPSDFTYRGLNAIEYSKLEPGEIYFAVNYLRSIGHYIKWTGEDSDYVRNNYFIVMDKAPSIFCGRSMIIKNFVGNLTMQTIIYSNAVFQKWMSGSLAKFKAFVVMSFLNSKLTLWINK